MRKLAHCSYGPEPEAALTFHPFTTQYVLIVLILLSFCSACGQKTASGDKNTDESHFVTIPSDEEIISLTVKPAAVIVKAGETAEFSVEAVGASGRRYYDADVDWFIDDIKVATLQGGRQVSGVSAGTALLQAQWQGVSSNVAEVIVPSDPLFEKQWHLKNIGQNGGYPGEDINVEPVWRRGVKGNDVVVAVVDDGLEIGHKDLAGNVKGEYSWNYTTYTTDPTSGNHGTAVAGIIGARDSNGTGGLGVSPRAGLVGFNLLQNYSSVNESDAMLRHANTVGVSNNSWGAVDGTGELFRSYDTWRHAVSQGVYEGRNGKGIVYVWAAGNGGRNEVDNSNFDGQANSRFVMAVAAVGDDGVRAGYSEQGANLWLAAPSRGYSGQGLLTTDRTGERGFNASVTHWDVAEKDFTKFFSGTSAAAPVVSGVAALVLEANPQLTWRDVRIILARSARMNDPADDDWSYNAGAFAYHINHKYGFGVPDAAAAVKMAQTWQNVGEEYRYHSPSQWEDIAIPDDDDRGVYSTINVPEDLIVEYVEIVFDASDHGDQGDLQIVLTSPSGTQSVLAQSHPCRKDPCTSRYRNWLFGSARHLGESSLGQWQLHVSDQDAGHGGHLRSWSIRVYGRKDG